MGGRRGKSAGESQTPDRNWEQQAVVRLGREGPAIEEEQSMEEQGIWMKVGLCHWMRGTLDQTHL